MATSQTKLAGETLSRTPFEGTKLAAWGSRCGTWCTVSRNTL